MFSFRNMNDVISNQVKNLKIVYERKKDEHDHLLNALREMQAEDPEKERLGKRPGQILDIKYCNGDILSETTKTFILAPIYKSKEM